MADSIPSSSSFSFQESFFAFSGPASVFGADFAASLAASKNLHIRVTAQLKLLPKLGQMLLLLTTDIIWLIFCIIVVNVGTDFIISMSDRPMVSGALMLDMRYVYAAVPIAFTLQAVRLVERWWRIFTKRDPLVVPSEEVF